MSRRRWWRAGLAAGVVLALVGTGVLAWTWRHPTAFAEAGGWTVGDRRHQGESIYLGMTFPGERGEGTVDIDHAEANVLENTAEAEIEVLVCTIGAAEPDGAIGSVDEDGLGDFCSTVEPAQDVSMSIGAEDRQQLLVAVTTTEPGGVRIHGVDVTYSYGWQHGTQRIGGDIELHTRAQRGSP